MRTKLLPATLLVLACCSSPRPGNDAATDPGGSDLGVPVDGPATESGPDAISISVPPDVAGCTLDGAVASGASTDFGYAQLTTGLPIQDHTVYLLTILEHDPALVAALAADATLGPMTTARLDAFRRADSDCRADTACLRTAIVPDATARAATVVAISNALNTSGRLPAVVAEMRASGNFALSERA